MRTYAHLATAARCEAPACAVPARLCSLVRLAGGWVRACTRAHAEDADRHLLSEEEARQVEAENHLVDGEEVELDAPPTEGPTGLLW